MSIGFKFYDWFSRDEDRGYTNYDINKRSISWDQGLDQYSDFFFDKKYKSGVLNKKQIEDASSLLLTMSKVVGINSGEFTSCKVSGKVQLPTDLLKSANMDVFLGASLQNMAHKIYHEESQIKTAEKILAAKDKISGFIFNILNMERVNNQMSNDTPGYLNFIAKYKDHQYSKRPELEADSSKKMRFMELFDRIIRYPTKIEETEVEEFKDIIDQIKSLLTKNNGIPDSFSECKKLAYKISDIIKTYFEEEEKEEKKDESPKDDSDSSEKSEDSDGGGGFEMESDEKSDKEDEDEKTKKEEKFNSLLKKLSSLTSSQNNNDSELFKEFMNEVKMTEDLNSSHGSLKRIEYVYPKSDKYIQQIYKKDLATVDKTKASVISNLLKRKSRDYKFVVKSMRSGRLDTNKLAEAKQMVPTIYEKIGEVKTNKLCVGILVDESGSMTGAKAESARKAAIFLNESLKRVTDVELFIYGHTADWTCYEDGVKGGRGHTQLFIYKEPGYNNEEALGYISGKYENRDGHAMLAAAKRIRSVSQNNGVFICISDGSPCAADYRGTAAHKHVRTMANVIESMGFDVIQVTIGGYRSTDMFKNVVNIDSVSEFPTKFVAFLKKKINSLIKEKVKL